MCACFYVYWLVYVITDLTFPGKDNVKYISVLFFLSVFVFMCFGVDGKIEEDLCVRPL